MLKIVTLSQLKYVRYNLEARNSKSLGTVISVILCISAWKILEYSLKLSNRARVELKPFTCSV